MCDVSWGCLIQVGEHFKNCQLRDKYLDKESFATAALEVRLKSIIRGDVRYDWTNGMAVSMCACAPSDNCEPKHKNPKHLTFSVRVFLIRFPFHVGETKKNACFLFCFPRISLYGLSFACARSFVLFMWCPTCADGQTPRVFNTGGIARV